MRQDGDADAKVPSGPSSPAPSAALQQRAALSSKGTVMAASPWLPVGPVGEEAHADEVDEAMKGAMGSPTASEGSATDGEYMADTLLDRHCGGGPPDDDASDDEASDDESLRPRADIAPGVGWRVLDK